LVFDTLQVDNSVATVVISLPNGKALYDATAYRLISMPGYYDVVLGLIPLTMLGVSGGLWAAGMALSLAVPLAGVLVIALIGHAMFVRTPGQATGTAPAPDPAEFNSAD
jgi:hypothetical protein